MPIYILPPQRFNRMLQLLKPASPSCCSCAEGKACGGKRKGARQSKASAEKAAKRRRLVGGMLKTVGAAAPGQQCTQCGTQVRFSPPAVTLCALSWSS